ncbi:hypothetical protein OROMI_005248 [Orobanche minor]
MALVYLDDLDPSEEELDSVEKDARDADRLTQISNCAPIRKRAAPIIRASPRKKSAPDFTRGRPSGTLIKGPKCAPIRKRAAPRKKSQGMPWGTLIERGLPIYLLFEFASGYALFHACDVDEVESNFESAEKYINRFDEVFKLKAFHPFESAADALCQMNAIHDSTVTEQLKSFLVRNLPKPIIGKPNYSIAVSDPWLGSKIVRATRMPIQSGRILFNVMRGLRMNIYKFIKNLKPGDLEKAQLNLARSYSRQRCSSAYKENPTSASSSAFHELVVPHRFEGVFIAMGKEENAICTKNLVPGEAPFGEELISVQNDDGTEVEYRVWNPFRSKLAAAIMSGVNNIWVKPGSRVLYVGDVCGTTLSHLSDIVGPDGLVYAVGLSDAVVNMAEKRPNVVTIFENYSVPLKYRMVVGMVDVIVADTAYPQEVINIATNAAHFLRAGGHYMISTQANQGETMFGYLNKRQQREFKPIELVMLKPIESGHAMAVGGFRILEA